MEEKGDPCSGFLSPAYHPRVVCGPDRAARVRGPRTTGHRHRAAAAQEPEGGGQLDTAMVLTWWGTSAHTSPGVPCESGSREPTPPPGQRDTRDGSAEPVAAFPCSPAIFGSDGPTLSFSQSRPPRSQHYGGVSGEEGSFLMCVIISSARASATVKSEPSSVNTPDLKSHVPSLCFKIQARAGSSKSWIWMHHKHGSTASTSPDAPPVIQRMKQGH